MLRISKLADYATVVMVYLSRHQGVANAKEIAKHTHLAVPTVSKLLKLLTQAGLLVSQRGVRGGYALAAAPSVISVAEIIHAIEGEPGLTECAHTNSLCALQPVCHIKGNWRLINQAVEQVLRNISLAQFADTRSVHEALFTDLSRMT